MQICLIRRLVNRESGRFEASEGVNITDLYTMLHVQNSMYAVAKVFWVVKRANTPTSICVIGVDPTFMVR